MNESDFQKLIKIKARSQFQSLLFRNNSGCLTNLKTNTPVRFGLGNDSSTINKIFKSSDLIGITTVKCECGEVYGVFTAVEVKKPGWKPNYTDPVYGAQRNFIETIRKNNGLCGFVSKIEELDDVFK